MIKTKEIERAKKEIKKLKFPIIVEAQDDSFNRKILEHGKFQALIGLEKGNRKDSIRQLDSGLNHVLAKIAAKNNISIGVYLKDLSELSKTEKARSLARLKQNIKICRKARASLAIIGNKKIGSRLLLSLGASTEQVKKTLCF